MPGICGSIADESQRMLDHIILRFGATYVPLWVTTQTHTSEWKIGSNTTSEYSMDFRLCHP